MIVPVCNCMAGDLADRMRPSDIDGYHGGGIGWIVIFIIFIIGYIIHKIDERNN